jgi:hypothetical protein
MKVLIEKLGREVEAPDGMIALREGCVEEGDLTWKENGDGTGFWGPPAHYGIGSDVAGYWCVLRAWKDDGAGI